ncbi:ECF transporter S component [Candidatus Galacturonibacter soehngenii]|uniref:ECF transporter S component n=1 Tax=Candidatus Galacturonatibacter soehngenii TaxID=2307010 RepID=A0A7V7UDP1_9FIRM|nr:ECF transporter S component [Candidatus Galacturonibacter soehngenii]KAB1440942.1 ECF transporter S component [Candidatus Galacturonibacter soehngenii]
MSKTKTMTTMQSNLSTLALNGMFIALTLLSTAYINVKLPIASNGGLIHLGNIPLFVCALLFGKRSGAIVGACGMGLFDLISGWAIWAPFTFIIVGAMGYIIGFITEKKKGIFYQLIALVFACLIKVIGYYVAEVILYHNIYSPLTSIPGNIIQVTLAAIIVLPILNTLKRGIQND